MAASPSASGRDQTWDNSGLPRAASRSKLMLRPGGRSRAAAENCCFPRSLWSESRCPSPHPGAGQRGQECLSQAVAGGDGQGGAPGALAGRGWGRLHHAVTAAWWQLCWGCARSRAWKVPGCLRGCPRLPWLGGGPTPSSALSHGKSPGLAGPAPCGAELWLRISEAAIPPVSPRPHPTYTPPEFKGRAQAAVVRLRLSELGDGGHSQKSGPLPF